MAPESTYECFNLFLKFTYSYLAWTCCGVTTSVLSCHSSFLIYFCNFFVSCVTFYILSNHVFIKKKYGFLFKKLDKTDKFVTIYWIFFEKVWTHPKPSNQQCWHGYIISTITCITKQCIEVHNANIFYQSMSLYEWWRSIVQKSKNFKISPPEVLWITNSFELAIFGLTMHF